VKKGHLFPWHEWRVGVSFALGELFLILPRLPIKAKFPHHPRHGITAGRDPELIFSAGYHFWAAFSPCWPCFHPHVLCVHCWSYVEGEGEVGG
jgi:hypothetical protein